MKTVIGKISYGIAKEVKKGTELLLGFRVVVRANGKSIFSTEGEARRVLEQATSVDSGTELRMLDDINTPAPLAGSGKSYGIAKAAKKLGIPKSILCTWASRGKVPHDKEPGKLGRFIFSDDNLKVIAEKLRAKELSIVRRRAGNKKHSRYCFDAKKLAKILSIPMNFIEAGVAAKVIPYIKKDGNILFDSNKIADWVMERPTTFPIPGDPRAPGGSLYGYVSIGELANRMAVPHSVVRGWAGQLGNPIPHVRMGRRVLCPERSGYEWVKSRAASRASILGSDEARRGAERLQQAAQMIPKILNTVQ